MLASTRPTASARSELHSTRPRVRACVVHVQIQNILSLHPRSAQRGRESTPVSAILRANSATRRHSMRGSVASGFPVPSRTLAIRESRRDSAVRGTPGRNLNPTTRVPAPFCSGVSVEAFLTLIDRTGLVDQTGTSIVALANDGKCTGEAMTRTRVRRLREYPPIPGC